MKSKVRLLGLLISLMFATSAYSQRYKNASDTGKLNLEYVKVSNDIAALTSQITIAQNNMPGYQAKAATAGTNAQDAASVSSEQASKATNGSVSDARSAKRKAKKAYNEAKDARSANNNVSSQDNKIARLNEDLSKKQQRLKELDAMRASINEKILNQSPNR